MTGLQLRRSFLLQEDGSGLRLLGSPPTLGSTLLPAAQSVGAADPHYEREKVGQRESLGDGQGWTIAEGSIALPVLNPA